MRRAGWLWVISALWGCTTIENCTSEDDCPADRICSAGICRVIDDAGPDMTPPDMTPPDMTPPDMTPPDMTPPDMTDMAVDSTRPDAGDMGDPIDMATDAMPPDAGLSPEALCDGADNDEDGLIDEGLSIGEPCRAGMGACETDGVFDCDSNAGVLCRAPIPEPGVEECTAAGDQPVDEDCDGAIDEAITTLRAAGNPAEVGQQSAVMPNNRHFDVAMSNTHTVVLARLNVGMRAVIFNRGAEADGSINTITPFENGFQAQVVRHGDGFAFAAISPDDGHLIDVATLRWDDAGNPIINRTTSDVGRPIGRLVLVPSPADRVILFVRVQGRDDVLRRDLTNNLAGNRRLTLPTVGYEANEPFAAAARGDESTIVWPRMRGDRLGNPSLTMSTYNGQNVVGSLDLEVPSGQPGLLLQENGVVVMSYAGNTMHLNVLNGRGNVNLDGTLSLPDLANAGDDYVLLAATGNSGAVAALYLPGLRARTTLRAQDGTGQARIAAFDGTGAFAWSMPDGTLMLRSLRFGCR